MKRAFGLVTFLFGLFLLVVAVGHPFLKPEKGFQLEILLGCLVLGGLFAYQGWRWMWNIISMKIIGVDPDDPHIRDAQQWAQATLPRFWEFLAENKHHCFIKFPMATKAGVPEHVWAIVHSRESDKVVVSLASDPVDEPVSQDQRVAVPLSEIEDWQVMISPTEIRGGYSVGALARIARERGHRLSGSDQRMLKAFVDLETTGSG